MYAFLCRWMPERMAMLAAVFWYTAIIVLIIAFSAKPMAEFRYMKI